MKLKLTQEKPWYKSITIWIGILTILSGIVPLLIDLTKALAIPPAVSAAIGAILVAVMGVIQVIRRYLLETPPATIQPLQGKK